MKISEVAALTGITVRALHYYDEIGLLKPTKESENGYRIYGKKDLEVLQQILFFREMDFPLSQIKEILTNPNFNKREALINHKKILLKKQERINNLINLVDKTLSGDDNMSFKEFDNSEIEEIKNKYEKEVKEKYGNTDAYKESQQKTSKYNKNDWDMINGEFFSIFREFASKRSESPESEEVQLIVQKLQKFICDKFYNCTNEILSGLGQMYVADERFRKNIDKIGEGTAQFISQAIKVYCDR